MSRWETTLVTCGCMLVSSLAVASDPVRPDRIDKPELKVKDTWTYLVTDRSRTGETKERHLVLGITEKHNGTVLQSAKNSDSSMPPTEKVLGDDLSVSNSIDGKQVLVHKPYSFPLQAGKKWKVSYERTNPNKVLKLSRVEIEYTASGWDEVVVPAGKFAAFKVEGEGSWYNEFNPTPATAGTVSQLGQTDTTVVIKNQKPSTPAPRSGKIYRTYWYVPALKRDAKLVEEDFTTDGGLSRRSTWQLESCTVDGEAIGNHP